MQSLVAKADALRPYKKRKIDYKTRSRPADDPTLNSVTLHTVVPKSLRPTSPEPKESLKYSHVSDRKLRAELIRQSAQSARSKALVEDSAFLLAGKDAGKIEVEGELDKTWRVGQDEIVNSSGQEAAKGRREFVLDGGPYRCRYTRNGRHLAVVGKNGHVSTFDWQSGTLHSELQLRETCRDITFLHDQSHFAVAQKKYVFIYDRDGMELHRLKSHLEPTRLEFLPYHWLLASVGNAGFLKYQDTSTGQLLCEHRTKLGACSTMTHNPHNAVIYLGHQNGTVTLWTPNLPHPAVRILTHLGPVGSISVDPSSGGRYMASAGQDGIVKVWDCRNWKGAVRQWHARGGNAELDWSQKGSLAVATGGTINVYSRPAIQNAFDGVKNPPLYLTHPVPHRPLTSVRFCPYQDILTIGHSAGLSSILVPGSGEPNFDSSEADPFENKRRRREREVKGLLDKVQPDMITLDPEFVGMIAPPSKLTNEIPFARLPREERLKRQNRADETENRSEEEEGEESEGDVKDQKREEKEKKKMRGRGKALKRYLRKHRKNVIDPQTIAVRAKLEKEKAQRKKVRDVAKGVEEHRLPSALDLFRRYE